MDDEWWHNGEPWDREKWDDGPGDGRTLRRVEHLREVGEADQEAARKAASGATVPVAATNGPEVAIRSESTESPVLEPHSAPEPIDDRTALRLYARSLRFHAFWRSWDETKGHR